MTRASRTVALLVAAGSLWAAPSAFAGPPLVCHPYQIGDAKSLPCDAKGGASKGYDRAQVVDDTLALLKTERDYLVRMETLRRATVYVGQDRDRATELLAKLSWMALDAEAAGNSEWARTAWFDAGFLASCYHQNGVDIDWKPGVADHLQGWAWIQKAIDQGADDPAVQFAAALVLLEKNDGSHRAYLARAVAGAEPGSNLARSIEKNGALGGRTIEELRASLGTGNASTRTSGR